MPTSPNSQRDPTFFNPSLASPISEPPLQRTTSSTSPPHQPQRAGYESKTWITTSSTRREDEQSNNQLTSPQGSRIRNQSEIENQSRMEGSSRSNAGNGNGVSASSSRVQVGESSAHPALKSIPSDGNRQQQPSRSLSSNNLNSSNYSGLPTPLDSPHHARQDSSNSVSSGPKPPPLIYRNFGLDPTLRTKASTVVPEDPSSSSSTPFGSSSPASSPNSPDGVSTAETPKKEKKDKKDKDKDSGGQPLFNVEIKANRFDSRGWPVFSGTAPLIRGRIRMPADIGCEVTLTLAAHTTLGAPAAMWEDVSLMPYETGTERKVFSVTDRFQPNFDLVSARPPLPDANSRKDWPRHEDYILEIPFDVNLPMGCATRIVDGKMETSHVPLPPSFEISSEGNQKEKERKRKLKSAMKQKMKDDRTNQQRGNGDDQTTNGSTSSGLFPLSRSTSNSNGWNSGSTTSGSTAVGSSATGSSSTTGSSILGISIGRKPRSKDGREGGSASNAAAAFRGAVERGFEQVYRIGCYYYMTFQLQRNSRKSESGTTLRIPFLFLGESFVPPNPPPSLPMQISLPPAFLMQQASSVNAANAPSASPLGSPWTSIKSSAKWSGSGWKSMRKGVEVELHTPSNTVFAPSAVPFLLVLRPNDTSMFNNVPVLPSFGQGQNQNFGQGHGSPSQSEFHSPPDSPRTQLNSNFSDGNGNQNARPSSSAGSTVARWMRGSLTLSRAPSNVKDQQSASSPTSNAGRNRTNSDASRPLTGSSGKRPSTAPSVWNSDSPPSTAGGNGALRNVNSNNQGATRSAGPFGSFGNGLGNLATASASVLNFGRGGTTERNSDNSGGTTALPLGSNGQGYQCCLSDLVRVSLIQATYCVSASVNETPEKRKRLISLADLEEVDLSGLSATEAEALETQTLSDEERMRSEEKNLAASVAAKTSGVRIMRGLLKIGSDATPGFRSQGLEVKYAIKVDLLPYSSSSALTSTFRSLGVSKSNSSTINNNLTLSPTSGNSRGRGLSDGMSSSGSMVSSSPGLLGANSSPPTTPPTNSNFQSSSMHQYCGNGYERERRQTVMEGDENGDGVGMAYTTDETDGAVSREESTSRYQRQQQQATTPTQPSMAMTMSSPPPPSQYASTSLGSPSLSSARSPTEMYGSSQIGSPDQGSSVKLSKSIGALWCDVRLLRAALPTSY